MNIVLSVNGVESVAKIVSHMENPITTKRFYRGRDGCTKIHGRPGVDINWATRFWAGPHVYNSGHLILGDKGEARSIMEEAGVNVSHHVEGGARKWVARSHSNHYCGHGIRLCDTEEEAARHAGASGYYSPWFEKQKEYRVHVGHDHLIWYQKKHGEFDSVDWNHGNGAKFKHIPNDKVYTALFNESAKAVAALGMSYGAVDIGAVFDGSNNLIDCAVFEVNSSPLLEESASKAYAKYFDWIVANNPCPSWVHENCTNRTQIKTF